MTIAKLLPLAFVMIAGPQILSAIFLATTPKWRQNSAAFVLGGATAVTTWVTIAFVLGTGAEDNGTSRTTLDVLVLLLLAAAAVHKYVTRKQSKPPKWMGELEGMQPKGSLRLGFLLLALFPGDILTALAVGGYASGQGDSWFSLLPFIALTSLFLALPALALLVLGAKGQAALPKVRDWMDANSWVTSEIVLFLFMAMVGSSLVS